MGLWQRIVAALGGPVVGGFDRSPRYLLRWDWARRRRELLRRMPDWMGGAFARTNADDLSRLVMATGAEARLHVVFNIGADALRGYAASGQYSNVYERPVVEGKTLAPSPTRLAVDRLIGLVRPERTYFCALSVGGTGMRFYGEYCVALKSPQDAAGVRRVLDRNSFDFARPPLSSLLAGRPLAQQQRIVARLFAAFRSAELADMLAIKVLQQQGARPRLLTMGAIGQAVLSDEDYAEALHEGQIGLPSVLEVRSHPEDEATESAIERRFANGEAVTSAELQWIARRRQARAALVAGGLAQRVFTGNGRGQRWR